MWVTIKINSISIELVSLSCIFRIQESCAEGMRSAEDYGKSRMKFPFVKRVFTNGKQMKCSKERIAGQDRGRTDPRAEAGVAPMIPSRG